MAGSRTHTRNPARNASRPPRSWTPIYRQVGGEQDHKRQRDRSAQAGGPERENGPQVDQDVARLGIDDGDVRRRPARHGIAHEHRQDRHHGDADEEDPGEAAILAQQPRQHRGSGDEATEDDERKRPVPPDHGVPHRVDPVNGEIRQGPHGPPDHQGEQRPRRRGLEDRPPGGVREQHDDSAQEHELADEQRRHADVGPSLAEDGVTQKRRREHAHPADQKGHRRLQGPLRRRAAAPRRGLVHQCHRDLPGKKMGTPGASLSLVRGIRVMTHPSLRTIAADPVRGRPSPRPEAGPPPWGPGCACLVFQGFLGTSWLQLRALGVLVDAISAEITLG